MGAASQIQWTDDTHNFWYGCTKVSPGCANCYAETLMDKRYGKVKWGKGAPRVRSKSFNAPLAWNKKPWVCDLCGHQSAANRRDNGSCINPECAYQTGAHGSFHRRRVFSLSLGDIGDPEVPFQWFNDAMVIVEKCANLDFLLLTKRPADFWERWQKVCEHWCRDNTRLPNNVWMGVSVEDQQRADERLRILLGIPAVVRFVSYEPALGPVNWKFPRPVCMCGDYMDGSHDNHNPTLMEQEPGISWVIIGGESGAGARTFDINWARDTVRQCRAAGVAVFVKQLGARPLYNPATLACDFGEMPLVLRDKKGGDISEFPENLKIREWPKVEVPA